MGATSITAVIFDLDGTLVDSLEDIADALGGALADAGLARPPVELVRGWIGDGAHSLVRRAVDGRADVEAVLAAFRERYRAQPIVKTRLYDGVAAALDELAGPGRSFAVLSNKPHDLTRTIADRLLAPWPFAAIFGQRPGLPLKPDPTVALVTADELGDRRRDRPRRRDARGRRGVGVSRACRARGGAARRPRRPPASTRRSDGVTRPDRALTES